MSYYSKEEIVVYSAIWFIIGNFFTLFVFIVHMSTNKKPNFIENQIYEMKKDGENCLMSLSNDQVKFIHPCEDFKIGDKIKIVRDEK